MTGSFVIALGEFKGKFILHSLKLLKSNGSQDIPKYGLIEDVLKEKLAQELLQKRKASHQVLTRKRKTNQQTLTRKRKPSHQVLNL